MSTVLATVAFLLLLHTSLLSQAGIMHYSQQLTLQHSTKLLFVLFFLSRSKLNFKVPTTTWRVPPGHILTNLIINWLLDANANRKCTDSERFETPKTDRVLNFYKDKEFYQLGFQVCWSWKCRGACHLKTVLITAFCKRGRGISMKTNLFVYHQPQYNNRLQNRSNQQNTL